MTLALASLPQTLALPPLPLAREIPFADFNDKYAGGSCYVVGRGPTEFDYERLADLADPIFFINDAVCLEKYARSETFFIAHDTRMRVWLDGAIRATAIMPIDGKVLFEVPGSALNHTGGVVYYHWREKSRRDLLHMSRDEVAGLGELFLRSGTIHSLLHFLWYCGFHRINFVGCDGINSRRILRDQLQANDGYDRRLQNMSLTSPGWRYSDIRRAQDLLITLFGFEANYLGTPKV